MLQIEALPKDRGGLVGANCNDAQGMRFSWPLSAEAPKPIQAKALE